MRTFELERSMLTMGGTFYPTGYVFAMFPSLEDAENIATQLPADPPGKPAMLLPADTVLGSIVSTVGAADTPLPSAGTEAATVRTYAELASQGHCALMVYADSAAETRVVMDVLRNSSCSCARKYRMLVIEDLV
ncbi:hypothetical protein [Rhodoferax sp.]|uniref:hypothetical protein n=1 Tax=Rhodoferax sp. TaxID=50421 RepID=UPI00374D4CEF